VKVQRKAAFSQWDGVEGLLDQVGQFGDLVIAGAVYLAPPTPLTRETYTLDHRQAAAQSDDA
jgi:hypothetical protein